MLMGSIRYQSALSNEGGVKVSCGSLCGSYTEQYNVFSSCLAMAGGASQALKLSQALNFDE